jgi:hypothetical protein
MRMSIRHNSNYLIEFDQLQINGRRALGGYAFTFTLKGKRNPVESFVVIFDLSLSLSTANHEKPIASSIPALTRSIQCGSSSNSENISFEVIFTKEQINSLEEYRQEKDLQLSFGLKAITSSNGQVWSSFEVNDVTIPRESWLVALRAAGFRQTILFEVPLPDMDKELESLVSKAQEFIETGHYKDAVMQCRHIIEQIEKIRDDKALSLEANKKSQNRQEREDMTAIERMLSVREQLKSICHLGAHGREFFTRSQARSVLGMTLALLAEPTIGFADNSV